MSVASAEDAQGAEVREARRHPGSSLHRPAIGDRYPEPDPGDRRQGRDIGAKRETDRVPDREGEIEYTGTFDLIDKLELLLALAKERHFGRAAEACGVTQPTMSTSLKQLEEILGVMLVQRGSRFQGFTPEGERTLDWARRIVGDARAMRQEINSLKDKLSGEIRIAAIPTVLGMVAQLTTPFRARYPDVRFRIQSCTSADVLGLLENLEVDAGLTYIENEPIGKVRTIPLYNESYRLL